MWLMWWLRGEVPWLATKPPHNAAEAVAFLRSSLVSNWQVNKTSD